MYVVTLAPTVIVVSPFLKLEFVARWIVKPASLLELSVQAKLTVGGLVLMTDGVATRFEGANGAAAVTITVFVGWQRAASRKLT